MDYRCIPRITSIGFLFLINRQELGGGDWKDSANERGVVVLKSADIPGIVH